MFCIAWVEAVPIATPTFPKRGASKRSAVTLAMPEKTVMYISDFWWPVIISVTPAEPVHTATSRPAERIASTPAACS